MTNCPFATLAMRFDTIRVQDLKKVTLMEGKMKFKQA
jgi:hypothetical protein